MEQDEVQIIERELLARADELIREGEALTIRSRHHWLVNKLKMLFSCMCH